MKIYISADIEGVTGVTNWDETDMNKTDSTVAREQMTAEVAAACEGAIQSGASEVWVKDAHGSGRNILAARLPRETHLVRSWIPDPLMMMQELDASFHGAMLIGYHSRAGSNANPLAHTMSGAFDYFKINDLYASECLINTYAAAMLKVPLFFVSGDEGLCDEVKKLNSRIETVAVKKGIGGSTVSIHPEVAVSRIREGVARALKGDPKQYLVPLPEHFSIEIRFQEHMKALRNSFYPGARQKDAQTVVFATDNYYEVLRLLLFVA